MQSLNMSRKGGFLITKIHYLSGRIFALKLKRARLDKINPAQGRILFVLWQDDGISIQELAQKTSLGKSTLTSMLDRLEKAGHLKREAAKDDRRKTIIRLTEKDKALHSMYFRLSEDMTGLFYSGFSTAEMDQFETYLKRILSNLESAESEQ